GSLTLDKPDLISWLEEAGEMLAHDSEEVKSSTEILPCWKKESKEGTIRREMSLEGFSQEGSGSEDMLDCFLADSQENICFLRKLTERQEWESRMVDMDGDKDLQVEKEAVVEQ
ncbi:UNVERIFIED_CONTAM: hypothetical protein K2H54_061270, partial [Gekko kuhli]